MVIVGAAADSFAMMRDERQEGMMSLLVDMICSDDCWWWWPMIDLKLEIMIFNF